jgi:hypothetical protein
MELYRCQGGSLAGQKPLTAEIAKKFAKQDREDCRFCFSLRPLRLFSANFAVKGLATKAATQLALS